MGVCISWIRSITSGARMPDRRRSCSEKMGWPGGVGSLVKMSLACENMSEMVERPRAFSESAKFLPTTPRCRREQLSVSSGDRSRCLERCPRSPNYNRHIVIDPQNPPDNYSHEKMRGGDFAYRWLVEIRHNSDPPVPGDGSAIFFHIRRGVNRPTTGCTTMAEPDLVRLVSWLRAPKHPCYALLTRQLCGEIAKLEVASAGIGWAEIMIVRVRVPVCCRRHRRQSLWFPLRQRQLQPLCIT